MTRRLTLSILITLCLSILAGPVAAREPRFSPGSPGAGDPYFPLDGNGGYNVLHYLLDVRYNPANDRLNGVATITARAGKNLSRFNLDLDGLNVGSVRVDGDRASFRHRNGELVVTPPDGIEKGDRFKVVVRYGGVPETLPDFSGFIHTDDGALVVGQPHVAATWFPANDHPGDRARFTFKVTVPSGLEVVANGVPDGQRTQGRWTTWTWVANDPMATYLAGMAIGELAISAYEEAGIRYWDALDPDLFTPIATPTTGTQFALAQQADLAYKRLGRTIAIPDDGAQLSFSVTRETEPAFDFFLVEAHTPGQDDWTTLRDLEGHATQDPGFACPFSLELHPFLSHYLSPPATEEELCAPVGDTGEWWAASGSSGGPETWTIDLSAWAGGDVEVALTYVTDDVVQTPGLFVDDIVVSTGEGSTSFEDDGDIMDGWSVLGAPATSPGNANDWIVGTEADVPPSVGEVATASLARQPEIIGFLEEVFGAYPFDVAGGIVDDAEIFFALENQTRPIYSKAFFTDSFSGDAVVVHELAHQWFGDSLTIHRWQHIWLNEGFATYAEWLWAEREGLFTPQEAFDFWSSLEPDDPFWSIQIGDPGPDGLFDFAVYNRGAMTLHQLRLIIGDDAFFELIETWARTKAGETVTTQQFIGLAERISGMQLDDLFDEWLFTASKPDVGASSLRGVDPQRSNPADQLNVIERLLREGTLRR